MKKPRTPHPRNSARKELVSIIEDHAYHERMPMHQAGPYIVSLPQHFELVLAACGQWYTGKPPSVRVLRKWYDKRKQELAKKHPHLTPEEHLEASPYLPLSKRVKDQTQKRLQKEIAQRLFARNYPRKYIAKQLGVSTQTVYRWIPVK